LPPGTAARSSCPTKQLRRNQKSLADARGSVLKQSRKLEGVLSQHG
jgi:hypothetical protein